MAGYTVVVSGGGSVLGDVDLPDAKGTWAAGVQFISNHLPPSGHEFDIRDEATGRLASYVEVEPTVPRRYRLHVEDVTVR